MYFMEKFNINAFECFVLLQFTRSNFLYYYFSCISAIFLPRVLIGGASVRVGAWVIFSFI